MRVLTPQFYSRSPLTVAPALLGKVIVRICDQQLLMARIVETEAYLAENDPASHSFRGRTKRNAVQFGPPGRAYIHAIHRYHCSDVVCEPETVASSVLIRAAEPLAGIATMQRFRNQQPIKNLTSGPGKLSQALNIDSTWYDHDITDGQSDLYIADDGYEVTSLSTSPRIGISTGKELPYRFAIPDNPFVSRP